MDCSNQYDCFEVQEVQHVYVAMKIKEVINIQIFLGFTGCTHSNFLPFLFRDIPLISTDGVQVQYAHFKSLNKDLESER